MKTLKITSKIGMMVLSMGIFSSTILFANGNSGDTTENAKSKDEIAAEKLASTIILDKQLMELEFSLTEEGVISCSEEITVKILNKEDEVVYEGSYNGIATADKTLRKYMNKADLLVNAGNVVYYMLF